MLPHTPDETIFGYHSRHFTAQDGLSLHYRAYGEPSSDRLPVLCLPGLTRNAADFDLLASRLASKRRIICPDYRGRGRSGYDRNWRNYTPMVYLNDLNHLLMVAGVARVVVIGTSLGGLLAMGLAAMRPTAVAGVVLNDIGPELPQDGLGAILDLISIDRPQPDWDEAVDFLRSAMPGLALRPDTDWRRIAEGTYRRGEDGLLHFDWDVNLIKPLLSPPEPIGDLWPLYRTLWPVPTLSIRGDISDMLSGATFARMQEVKADLVAVTIPRIGHAPTLDEPEALRALDDFLEQF
jgi:pimeloyl-ACP methyl ester carboxylesterase